MRHSPHELARIDIQRCYGALIAQLDDHSALIVTNRKLVGVPRGSQGPCPLQAIIERRLGPVGGGVPQPHRAVLRGRDDEGQARVEAHARDVVRVSLERLQAGLGLVVPDLDCAVVGARKQVGLIASRIVVNAVDAPLMRPRALEGEVRGASGEAPDLDGSVKRGRCEGLRVSRVYAHHHDVVSVALKHLRALKVLFPVPQLDAHVVRGRQDERSVRVDFDEANVVCVRLPLLDLFHCVVIVYPQVHVVRAGDEPLLACYELGAAHGHLAQLEGLQQGVV